MVDDDTLLRVLAKIAYKPPDDEWDLPEEDYDVLE